MPLLSALSLSFSVLIAGLSLSADDFDWDTDDTDDYESPFADENDEPTDDAPFSPPEDKPVSEPASPSPGPDAAADTDVSSLTTMEDARALCNEAMDHLHDDNPSRAFDRLSAHWAFSQEEMTQLQGEVERTRAVVADRYGDVLDYRLVRENTAADALACFVYLERFSLHGLRWRFTFYKGSDGWSLNDVYFDDEIEALLE